MYIARFSIKVFTRSALVESNKVLKNLKVRELLWMKTFGPMEYASLTELLFTLS